MGRHSEQADFRNGGRARRRRPEGTVAAGDDRRIVRALQASRNGSDILDKGLFRGMLELGPASLLGVGTEAATVAGGDDVRLCLLMHGIRRYGAKRAGFGGSCDVSRSSISRQQCPNLHAGFQPQRVGYRCSGRRGGPPKRP